MKDALLEIIRQRRRLLLAALALLILNVALIVFVQGYLSPAISDSQTKWTDLRRRIAIAGQNDTTAIYTRGKADLEKLKSRIPYKRQFPGVLNKILETAASDNVTVGTLNYKPEVLKGSYLLTYGMSMSVSGSYAAVKSFLADMLKSNELIVVDTMTMTNSDLYEEKVVMDLRLTVYLQEDT